MKFRIWLIFFFFGLFCISSESKVEVFVLIQSAWDFIKKILENFLEVMKYISKQTKLTFERYSNTLCDFTTDRIEAQVVCRKPQWSVFARQLNCWTLSTCRWDHLMSVVTLWLFQNPNITSTLLNHYSWANFNVQCAVQCEGKIPSLPNQKNNNSYAAVMKTKVNRCDVSLKIFSGIVTGKTNNKLTMFTPLPCSDTADRGWSAIIIPQLESKQHLGVERRSNSQQPGSEEEEEEGVRGGRWWHCSSTSPGSVTYHNIRKPYRGHDPTRVYRGRTENVWKREQVWGKEASVASRAAKPTT